MKCLLLVFYTVLFIQPVFCQIDVVYDNKKKTVTLSNPKEVLKKGQTYTINLRGINTAHHSFKVETKSFELYSELPSAMSILPGIAGSIRAKESNFPLTNLSMDSISIAALKVNLQKRVEQLKLLKEQADSLYKSTRFAPNHAKAAEAYNAVNKSYVASSPNELMEMVGGDIYVLISIIDVLNGPLKNQTEVRPDLADLYAVSMFRKDQLIKSDYLKYAEYIIASRDAQNSKESKPFKSEKDLTEARLILVDTYKKNTLFNGLETLHNKGSFGLSFSTGFFYTRGLGDEPYYLEPRTDGNTAVKSDNAMKSDIAVGGFGHAYWKIGPGFRLGPGIGIAVSPFDGKTRYMAGAGFTFGREKMISINAGCAWSKVRELSNLVKHDAEGQFLPPDASEVPTFDKLRTAWFIGVTYNLLSTRK